MSSTLKNLTNLCLTLLVVLSICSVADAQDDATRRDRGGRGGTRGSGFGGPPGGGFTGGRRGGGGLLGEIQNEGTRSEIKLTEDQFKKLEEIGESSSNRDQFGDIFTRMQSAQTDEERTTLREELRVKMEATRIQAEENMKSVLSEDQFKRLDQIRLHRDGSRALGREEIQSELGLSEDQKQKLEALQTERGEKFRELGFQASEEDRSKLQQEFDQKTMSVLTDAQKTKWQERLGPPPADAGTLRQPVFGGRPPGIGGPPQQIVPRRVMVEQVPEGAEATLSFGTDKSKTEEGSEGQDRGPAKLSFNFRYAPWTEVLKLFARESELSLDLIDVPPGTFSYYDQNSYTPEQALDVLNGYLLPKGFVLVHRDDFLVSLNIDNPIPPNLIPKIKPEDLPNRGKNELLTVTFPLEGVDAAQIAAEVNEVKGPQGKVVALPSANSIMVTDIGSILIDIDTMLKEMVGRPGPDDMSFKSYQIKNLPAIEAEALLRSVLGIGTGVANVSAMNDGRSRSSSTPATITIAADERTNKLLVSTTSKTHLLIEEALKTIDVEGEASNFSAAANKPFLRVYSVTSADAREVVKTIDALMPGIVINEDGRNGKIHILASPDKHSEVENLIRQMDGMGNATQQMSVIPLSKMDSMLAAATVRAMFLKDGELAPTIEPDVYGRQLMVRGDANQLLQIKTLLLQLGEDGTGQRELNNESRIRTFPLSGRDPEEILPLIQRMWKQRSGSSIRVVNPDDRGPVRGIIQPGNEQSIREQANPKPEPASTQNQTERPLRESVQSSKLQTGGRVPLHNASQTTVLAQGSEPAVQEASVSKPAAGQTPNPLEYSDEQLLDLFVTYIQETPEAPPQIQQTSQTPKIAQTTPPENAEQAPADVNVTVVGDDLMIYSSDPEALNQLEELLESAMQAIPPSTAWTVFTLQTADATEASLMLEQLLPYSNVSSTSSSSGMLGSLSGAASSLGSGLAEMTGLSSIAAAGQSLRIIPDTRLNALFVSGPSSQVKEVEEMLRVLDASEWPDSLRDKITRLIPVEYADADDVLRMVKESYKVYIDPPQQQQGRGNPLAAMMGGGGSRGGKDGDSPESQIKMTVSVDSNTNQLAVWADESLFREVESFVQSVDEAARQARKTVRVVTLQNTNSSTIKGALGTLMPKVNVSSTASRRPESGANQQSGDNSNNSSNAEQDRIRQFFEQRMRERTQGGSGGGAPPTGGPPGFGSGRPSGGSPFGGGRTGGTGGSPFGGGGRPGGGR